jgi:hypothetical protein
VHTASGRFADTRFWLAWRRRMPLRPMAFLADAHRHGVLRQTGAAYQFEHGLLQQQLSAHHPRLPAGPASPTTAVLRRLHGLRAYPDPLQPPLSHVAGTEPIWAEHFGKAAARLPPALGVGAPLGGVMRIGPGCAQHFSNTAGQHPWVMCSLPGGEPVLVAWAVWAAARRAGAWAAENALAAVGYPVACARHETAGPRVIPADAGCVEMAGGSWGPGLLIRDGARDRWRWEPAEAFDPPSSWEDAQQHRPPGGESRIRMTATIPWACPGLVITAEAREVLLAKLRSSDLARAFAELPPLRGAAIPDWQPVRSHNARKCARYVCAVGTPDGRLLAQAEVGLSLSHETRTSTTVATHTELHLANPRLPPSAPAPESRAGVQVDDPRLLISLDELLTFLTAAWHMVSEVLPEVVAKDPPWVRLAGCPLVRCELLAAQHDDPGHCLSLADVVDFLPFRRGQGATASAAASGPPRPVSTGLTNAGPLPPSTMRIAIRGPLRHSPDYRSARARKAFVHMAQRHGFPDARENWREASP